MLTIPQIKKFQTSDPYIAEAMKQLLDAVNALNRAVGADSTGAIQAPPNIGSLKISAADGIFEGSITDASPTSSNRAIWYFAEYDVTASFQTPKIVFLGPSRNFRIQLGNQTLFWRAYSQFLNSPASSPVTFGSPATAVIGGGVAGPTPLTSQGSGTGGTAGGKGFGPLPRPKAQTA